jgi:hypothetical protein
VSESRQLRPPERVVAIEVIRVQEHLGHFAPVVAWPPDAQRHRGRGHEKPQRIIDFCLDSSNALLGNESLDVSFERGL